MGVNSTLSEYAMAAADGFRAVTTELQIGALGLGGMVQNLGASITDGLGEIASGTPLANFLPAPGRGEDQGPSL